MIPYSSVRAMIDKLRIKPENPDKQLKALSGGNQQKVVFAKWLMLETPILILDEPTDIEVIFAPEFGGWTEDGGFSLMEDMLAKHPNIDAVFAENDSMALGALKAIQDAGRADEIKIFGFDGQRAALKLISEGTNFIATGLNSPTLIGPMGFNHLMAVIAGAERVNIDTVFPVTVITEENVMQYYDPESVF